MRTSWSTTTTSNANNLDFFKWLMTNLPQKLVALLLPAALLWVFAGCVLTCENDSKEVWMVKSSTLPAMVQHEASCEECSISSVPVAMTSKRSILRFNQVPAPLPAVSVFAASSNCASGLRAFSRPPLLRDQPPDQRRPLRI